MSEFDYYQRTNTKEFRENFDNIFRKDNSTVVEIEESTNGTEGKPYRRSET